jgi:hypothetical protein
MKESITVLATTILVVAADRSLLDMTTFYRSLGNYL